jgi:hypothetical protein
VAAFNSGGNVEWKIFIHFFTQPNFLSRVMQALKYVCKTKAAYANAAQDAACNL